MQDFLLLLRGGEDVTAFSPEEMQKHMQEYFSWMEQLTKQGQLKGGQPLENFGRMVSGGMVTDKPLAESKEAIGGYFLIAARDLDHATETAKGCPILSVAGAVEVRQIRALA